MSNPAAKVKQPKKRTEFRRYLRAELGENVGDWVWGELSAVSWHGMNIADAEAATHSAEKIEDFRLHCQQLANSLRDTQRYSPAIKHTLWQLLSDEKPRLGNIIKSSDEALSIAIDFLRCGERAAELLLKKPKPGRGGKKKTHLRVMAALIASALAPALGIRNQPTREQAGKIRRIAARFHLDLPRDLQAQSTEEFARLASAAARLPNYGMPVEYIELLSIAQAESR